MDRLRYVPLGSTQLGCIFHEGLINGSSEYDGKWFPTTPAGDEVMKRIMASTPSTPQTGVSPLAAAASALVLLVAGFAAGTMYQLRRSRGPQRTDQAIENVCETGGLTTRWSPSRALRDRPGQPGVGFGAILAVAGQAAPTGVLRKPRGR